jgi:hypothetical protein
MSIRGVWRYRRDNQTESVNRQTTQWPKVKVQYNKQRSTKHTDKTKDRVTRTPLKTMCIRYHVHIRINTSNDI